MKRLLLVVTLVLSAGCATTVHRVKVSPHVENTLGYLYKYLPVEFSLCAYGNVKKGVLLIERVDFPFIYGASEGNILTNFPSCPSEKAWGMIHSHLPDYFCRFSRTDTKNYFDREYTDSYSFDFLYCQGSILWRGKNDPPEKVGVTKLTGEVAKEQ